MITTKVYCKPPSDRWLVVVPSIRRAGKTLGDLWESLTVPSDLMACDGAAGVAQTLNGLRDLMLTGRWGWYVKVDDDILLPRGWQDAILRAFKAYPDLGAAGPDWSCTDEGQALMRQLPRLEGTPPVRWLPDGNLPGGCIVMPMALALDIGPIPVLGETTYHVYEDGWRCREVRRRGLRQAYVPVGQAEHLDLSHLDPPGYAERKARHLEAFQRLPGGLDGLA